MGRCNKLQAKQCRERPELELAHIGRLQTPGPSTSRHQARGHTKKILIKAPRSRGSLAIAGPGAPSHPDHRNISLWVCARHCSGACPVQLRMMVKKVKKVMKVMKVMNKMKKMKKMKMMAPLRWNSRTAARPCPALSAKQAR